MKWILVFMVVWMGCEVPDPPTPEPEPIPVPVPDPEPEPEPEPIPIPPTPTPTKGEFGAAFEVHDCPDGTPPPPDSTSTDLEGYWQLTVDGDMVCDMCGAHMSLSKAHEMQIANMRKYNREVTEERDRCYANQSATP